MTDSFPPNNGCKSFMVHRATTSMSATDGTNDTNLLYPFNRFSVEVIVDTNPDADDTVTIGSVTYTFVATPAAANDVDIGADKETTANNLRQALIDGNVSHSEDTSGASTYHGDTVINPDILHAELGYADDVVHVTADTALACAASAAKATVGSFDKVARTAFVHYGGRLDYTELKANSSEANSTDTRIVGYVSGSPAGTLLADTAMVLCDHAGIPVSMIQHDTPNSHGWQYLPASPCAGISGRLGTRTDDGFMAVFYH